MNRKLFANVVIFDGTGADPFPGEVLIDGNRIKWIGRGAEQIPREPDFEIIDGDGGCRMPGLVEAHGHLTYTNVRALTDLGDLPPEEHLLKTMHNAKLLLD